MLEEILNRLSDSEIWKREDAETIRHLARCWFLANFAVESGYESQHISEMILQQYNVVSQVVIIPENYVPNCVPDYEIIEIVRIND